MLLYHRPDSMLVLEIYSKKKKKEINSVVGFVANYLCLRLWGRTESDTTEAT